MLTQAAKDFYAGLPLATQAIIVALLGIRKGQKFSVVAETTFKMNKGRGANKNPLHGRVVKRALYGFRSQAYASVKEQATGEREVAATPWKEHAGEFVTTHKDSGQIYLEAKPELVSQIEFLIDGKPVTPSEFEIMKEFQVAPRKQGIPWVMVKIDCVKEFRGSGETIVVS